MFLTLIYRKEAKISQKILEPPVLVLTEMFKLDKRIATLVSKI